MTGGERDPWEKIEAWAKDGAAEQIAALGESLAVRRRETHERLRSLDRELGFTIRALALTPGRRFVEQLLVLLRHAREAHVGDEAGPRLLASLIAEAQPLDDALYVLRDGGSEHDELRACLFHELLLRGVNPELLLPRHTLRPEPAWHALAWLPDRLADMEYGVEFPSRGCRGSAGIPYDGLSSPVWVDAAVRRAASGHRVGERAPTDLLRAIDEPPRVGGWGNYEARVFVSERSISREDLPGVLTALPMDCVRGLGEHDRFEVEPYSLDKVWETLYATAAGGGMYHSGVYGAHGRLAAWRSIAGLCGAGVTATAAAVEHRARACAWYRFEADSEWFFNEIYDYGIAALAPDGRHLAVLAATDTD
ncbi:DUF6183 family protein [Streptomyces sp. MBT53]|uniref:DUF6183 family protein n=1 Tax=Streptomyces sp. MBT53 TaxID=1488384 RepID=UPI0019143FA0|nr:DUF6183 family protein [Streptomyces sp. MBT53]MBK6016984.1 hypothetical protein [Streptomyces sp. MBT53]